MAQQKALKPIVSIKNFSGMGDNGLYWLDGFSPKTFQGQTFLTQGWGSFSFIDNSVSGFSSLGLLNGMASYQHISDNQLACLDDNGDIFDFNIVPTNKLGKIHTIAISGTILPGSASHIISTRLGNLLYSSANHLGVGWVGQATGGSTTTLIDTSKNFVNLGLGTTAGKNKVYNYSKGVEYTITSITTTTNANDTLNFAAGTSVSSNDWYVAFADDRFSFGTTNNINLQLNPQPYPLNWNRQIELFNDTYYILNGNYLAALATDESTWISDLIGNQTAPSDKFKKAFPTNYQGLMTSSNQDRLLIACYNKGKGALLLWDGYASGWVSIIETEAAPAAIVKYGYYWIVLIAGSLYQTDGFTLTLLSTLPDADYLKVSTVPIKYNMIPTETGVILSYSSSDNSTRLVNGNYIYDAISNSWSYAPIVDKNGKPQQTYCHLFSTSKYSGTFSQATPVLFASYTTANGLSEIAKFGKTQAKKSSVLIYIKLPVKMGIEYIELNLGIKDDKSISSGLINKTNTIRVNYGQGEQNIYNIITPSAGSTSSSIVNFTGDKYTTKVGQSLMALSGANGYDRAYIIGITNQGTSGEVLSISPPLTTTPATSPADIIRKFDLYNNGSSLSINSDAFPQEIQFGIPSFYSDKLWLEVVFENQDQLPLDINAINIW